jgi:hypothetical protein
MAVSDGPCSLRSYCEAVMRALGASFRESPENRMSMHVVLRGSIEDKHALDSIALLADGSVIQQIERFEGLSSVIELSISLTPAIVAIVRKYLTETSKREVARELVIEGKTFRFKGFNADEIDKILNVASGISGQPTSDRRPPSDKQTF